MNRPAEQFGSQPGSKEEMLRQATQATGKGDVYTAVKILRKLLRMAPNWAPPYRKLVAIYKKRREWKPVMHYAYGLLECQPGDREALQDLGTAATALGKRKAARIAWNNLGYTEKIRSLKRQSQPIAIRLEKSGGAEVVVAEQLDPVQAILRSIPQPGSEFQYGDRLLFDPRSADRVLIGNETYPVYHCLQRLKMAHNQPYTAILHTADRKQLEFLRNLCRERGLGFDNWSRAERQTDWQHSGRSEYYRNLHEDSEPVNFSVVALAARQPDTVLDVLQLWQQITQVDFNRLFRLG